MGKIDEILVGLTERTDEGRLKWRTSVNPNGFVSAVGDIAVVVSLIRVEGFDADDYKLEILNDKGIAVEAIETASLLNTPPQDRRATDERAQYLRRLFTLARRSALDVDATLDELVKSLDAIR